MLKMEKNGNASEVKRTTADIPLDCIYPAEINVHRSAIKDDPSFAGLVESIRRIGIIHRIAVSPASDSDRPYVLIDGHRRYEAAKALGMKTIRAEICEVDEQTALAMTVAANVQRIANDPVLEADAIAELRRAGSSTREIASAIGRDERYVVRRERLVTLTKPWRDLALRCHCTADMLERIAAFEPRVQDEVAAVSELAESYEDGADVSFDEFESAFDARLRKIADAPFDSSACAKCPFNTATHEYLFPEMEDCENARCQDGNCYVRKWNAATDETIARLRREGREAIEVADRWAVPQYWDNSSTEDAEHPQAYVFKDGDIRRILWSKKPEERAPAPAMTAEEKARAKEEKRREKTMRSAYSRIREAFHEADDATVQAVVDRIATFNAPGLIDWAKRTILVRINGWCGDAEYDEIIRLIGGSRETEEAFGFDLKDAERTLLDERLANADADDGAEEDEP